MAIISARDLLEFCEDVIKENNRDNPHPVSDDEVPMLIMKAILKWEDNRSKMLGY